MSEKQIIITNFLKMLKNRNINIKKNENYDEYFDKLNVIDQEEKIYYFFFDKKIGVKDIKIKVLDKLIDKDYNSLILITRHKFNSYILNKLTEIDKDIEIFNYNNFYFNLVEHKLVPQHEILPEKKEKLIKEKFGNKLPLIKKTDPICRYYNCKPGQILKIKRKDEIYYRMVINN